MSHFNEAANTWDSEEKIQLMSTLAKNTKEKLNIKQKIDICDFGCGTGLFGLEFFESAKSITGIDTSKGMLEVFDKKASEFENISSLKIDLEKESLNQKFDLIISSMAFHHLEKPFEMIKKMQTMLNTNGRIAIVDLDEEDGSFHPDNKKMRVKHFGFSKDTLVRWAETLNIKLEYFIINSIEKNDKTFRQFLAVYSNN